MLLLVMSWVWLRHVGLEEALRMCVLRPVSYSVDDKIVLLAKPLTSEKTNVSHKYSETPYCKWRDKENVASPRPRTLGERVRGRIFEPVPYNITVGIPLLPKFCEFLCHQNLSNPALGVKWNESLSNGIEVLKYLIDGDYRVQMELDTVVAATSDDFSTAYYWGWPVGYKDGGDYYVINHLRFIISYNSHEEENGRQRIVGFFVEPYSVRRMEASDITSWNKQRCEDSVQTVTLNKGDKNLWQPLQSEITFTYDVLWKHTYSMWSERHISLYAPLRKKTYIPSIHHSIIRALLLFVFVAIVLVRIIHTEISSFDKIQTLDKMQAKGGWRLINREVFRPPEYRPMLLSVFIATGLQLFFVLLVAIIFGFSRIASTFAHHDTMLTAVIVVYILTGFIAGFCSSCLCKLFHCKKWRKAALITAFMFSGFVGSFDLAVNLEPQINISNSFGFFVFMFFVLANNVFLGSYIGSNVDIIRVPVEVNKIRRQIPKLPWLQSIAMNICAGILPFSSVYIEMHFVMNNLLLREPGLIYFLLLVVFVILFITCVEVSILACFYQLVNEDYQWWWKSFLRTGSSAVYLFFYVVWYSFAEATITSSTSFVAYFGYMIIACVAFFLITGSIGFFTSLIFVRFLYAIIKAENTHHSIDDEIYYLL